MGLNVYAGILEWSQTQGCPVDGELSRDGKLTVGQEHLEYDTQSLAKFAGEKQVPILLDH